MGWCTWEVLGKEEQAQGRWVRKESLIFTDIKERQQNLPRRKHCRRTGGEAKVEMEGVAWAACGWRYGPMSCVFEVGLALQSPENKRDADLQSACERSNEMMK